MDSSALSAQEPAIPVAIRLKLGSLYSRKQEGVGVGPLLVAHLRSHLYDAPIAGCQDPCCTYLNWFLQHYHGCQHRDSCSSCMKLMEWTSLHIETCGNGTCPLGTLCTYVKTRRLKQRMNTEFGHMDGLNHSGHHGVTWDSSRPGLDVPESFRSERTSGAGGQISRATDVVQMRYENQDSQNRTYLAQNEKHSTARYDVPHNGSLSPLNSICTGSEDGAHRRNERAHFYNGNGIGPASVQNGYSHYQNGNGYSHYQNGNGYSHHHNGNGYSHRQNGNGYNYHHNGNGYSHYQDGNGYNHYQNGTGERFHHNGDLQSQQGPSDAFTDRVSNYEQQHQSLLAGNHPHSTISTSSNCNDSWNRRSSPPIQADRAGADRPISVDPDLLVDPPDMKGFQRTMSMCSTMSIKDALQQLNSSNLTSEQASFAIRSLMASRRNSSVPSESVSTSSVTSLGDSLMSRQSSVDPNGSIRKSYRQSDSVEGMSSESQDADSGERRVRKRSSQNKLTHMHHVDESMDDLEDVPPRHTPVQRSETGDSNARVLVNGSLAGTVMRNYSCSKEADSSYDSSDDRVSSGGLESYNGSSQFAGIEGHISHPMQREDSGAENGSKDKLLLAPGRGSICVANLKHMNDVDLIRQYKMNRELIHAGPSSVSSNLPTRLVGGEEQYRPSRILTTSSSSGYSPDSSQPSSLEGSTSEVDEREQSQSISKHLAAGLDPEESLSPLLLKRNHQPRSTHPSVGSDCTPMEPVSWNLKHASSSSSGTIFNPPSEPTSPNFSSGNVTVSDSHSAVGRHEQSFLSGGTIHRVPSPEFRSKDFERVESGIDENGSEMELDPHIFAPLSDSEASASYASSHAHQQSLSDSDYDPKSLPQRVLIEHVPEDFEGICDRIDEIKEQHRDDLEVMRNRRKIMTQQLPLRPQGEGLRMAGSKSPSEDWNKDGDGPQEDEENRSPMFYERELDAYKDSLTPVNPDKVAVEEVNHREYLRTVSGCSEGCSLQEGVV